MNLASKDIRHNPGRFALTAVGVGMLLMIVMGMGGIYRGIIDDAVLLIDSVDADLWIVQRDTRGPMAEVSRVPRNLVHRALAVPGVESSREFVHHTIQRERNGKPLRIAVLGLSWPTDKGEWIEITKPTFSHDRTGKADGLDRFMGVEDGSFFLSHGGFVKGFNRFGDPYDRPATGRAPSDLKLPPLPIE